MTQREQNVIQRVINGMEKDLEDVIQNNVGWNQHAVIHNLDYWKAILVTLLQMREAEPKKPRKRK